MFLAGLLLLGGGILGNIFRQPSRPKREIEGGEAAPGRGARGITWKKRLGE